MPASKLRRMVSAPSGSTPKHEASAGRASFTAAATPAHRPPPADGDDDGVEVGHLLHELEAEGGGAQRGERALEGMDEGAAFLALDLLHAVEGRWTSSTSSTSAPSSRQRATRKGLAVCGITTWAVVPRTRAA